MGGASAAISSGDTTAPMRVDGHALHQYAYGIGDQAHFKAYKRHHTWVCGGWRRKTLRDEWQSVFGIFPIDMHRVLALWRNVKTGFVL